jgi:cytochrome b subunit of formate dehydrogenase
MNVITWGQNPWGMEVPVHIAWGLLWVSLFTGLAFMLVHAIWVRYHANSRTLPEAVPPETAARIPENMPRHSLSARIFHWVMAAAVLTLLFSAFLPIAGQRFAWVELHWAAGLVLVLAILFHVVHSVFFMDFRSIWPGKADLENGWYDMLRTFGYSGPLPGKPGKYPLGNKLYHLAAAACGLCVAATGVLMMARVPTPFLTRNPYLLGDMSWGIVYLLHGFAAVALIALVVVHVYFALRPEKLPVTKTMFLGVMSRRYYLEHHDPGRWTCDGQAPR